MAIQDSDLFLIDDAGVSKKIRADKLKGGLDSTYANMKLLVNKPDYSSRFVYCSDLQSNLPDDHWLMVERSSVSYKVSGTDVHSYFPSGPAGATGIITDSHTTPLVNGETGTHDLTVASLATPNFVDNEAIRMVNVDGDTSSYVPVTNTITNVSVQNTHFISDWQRAPYNNDGSPDPLLSGQLWVISSLSRSGAMSTNPLPTNQITYVKFKHVNKGSGASPGVGIALNNGNIIDSNERKIWWRSNPGAFQCEVNGLDPMNAVNPQGYDQNSNIGFLFNPFADNGRGTVSLYKEETLVAVGGNGWTAYEMHLHYSAPYNGSDRYEVNHLADLPSDASNSIQLTFADPCPDLKFFQPQDVVQTSPDEAKVIYRDPVARTMLVDGGSLARF